LTKILKKYHQTLLGFKEEEFRDSSSAEHYLIRALRGVVEMQLYTKA